MNGNVISFPISQAVRTRQVEASDARAAELAKQLHKAINQMCIGWIFSGNTLQVHAANYLRTHFCVRSTAEIPPNCLQEAIDIVRAMDAAAWKFQAAMQDATKAFLSEHINGGEPWTPAVQRKVTRALIPARPNWRELARMGGAALADGLAPLCDEHARDAEPRR